MGGWLRHLALTARVRTGFNAAIVVWAGIAGVAAAAMFCFLCIAAFVWLAQRSSPVTAGLLMAGFFLLVALIAAACLLWSRRRTIERARVELAARSNASLLDPSLLGVGLQIARAVGWQRLASLAAVGVLAAALSREWFGRDEKADTPTQD